MNKFNSKAMSLLVAKIFAGTCILGMVLPLKASGMLVLDGSNLRQNIISAMENVAHTKKQIEQYQTQLLQYENMLQNSTAPRQQIWDSATVTIDRLRSSIDTLNYYKKNLGSIDAYLAKFQDTASYSTHPCFSVKGCTPAQWNDMKAREIYSSETQKRANDAFFYGLEQQQGSIASDAAQLSKLQSAASGATGQLQAIGLANQLASHQTHQLMQLRALLISLHNTTATRQQAILDQEAREKASSNYVRSGTFRPSPRVFW